VSLAALHVAWRLLIGRVQTKIKLLHREIRLTNTSCEFCLPEEETLTHILLSSKKYTPSDTDAVLGLGFIQYIIRSK